MDDLELDKIILGTAALGGVWGKVDAEESVQTIYESLACGISALDTAPAYGDAEYFIGQALAQWKEKRPHISTKVGRSKSYEATEAYYDYSTLALQRSVEQSLATLGVSHIDLLFLHDPAALTVDQAARVLADMQSFKDQGLTKKIGIGGNPPDWFKPFFADGQFDVLMEYNKLNACNIDALQSTIPACRENKMEYYAASPLNMGLLGSQFQAFSKTIPHWLDRSSVEQARRIAAIAKRHELPLDNLSLRFLYSIPASFKIVMGAGNKTQLRGSLEAIQQGTLPEDIYNEILQTFNDNR